MDDDSLTPTSERSIPLNFSNSKEFSNYVEISSKSYCRLFKAQRYGKWYVLKGLQPCHAADPVYMAMLEKEFDTAIKLNHPNIVHTLAIEDDPVAGPCIVMEYIEGRTLTKFLEERPSAAKRRRVATQLLHAMCYYHSLQIVHRDLQPSNILITLNGDNVKLIDFGIADTDDYVILKEPAYTEGYAAPEQVSGTGVVDCRTDQYAFGVLLRQFFPHRYRWVARRCTRVSPDRRYRDMQQVIRALKLGRAAVALTIAVAIAALLLAVFLFAFGEGHDRQPDPQSPIQTDKGSTQELDEKRDMIYQRFEAYYSQKKELLSDDKHWRAAPVRYLSTQAVRSVCLLTDNDILEAVRAAPDLRLRDMKSGEEMKTSDMTVVEQYLVTDMDNTYGYCRWSDSQPLVLVNTAGAIEPCMSHITAVIADNTRYNIISRERRFYGAADENGITVSPFYIDMQAADGNAAFGNYLAALRQIKKGQRVVCLMSGASGGADFEMEWGMPKGTVGYQFDGAHVADGDRQWVRQLGEALRAHAANITVHSSARKDFTFNFTFKTNSKGYGISERQIARAIYNQTGATVVMLYLNVQTILNAPDERYYAAIKVLLDALEEVDASLQAGTKKDTVAKTEADTTNEADDDTEYIIFFKQLGND